MADSSAGSKRAAAAAGLAPAPASQRARRAAAADSFAPGAMAEGALAGEEDPKELAALEKQIASRKSWERWSTPLLFAWLWDFGAKKPSTLYPADAVNRDKIITLLVDGRYPPPQGGTEEEQFFLVWGKHNGHKGAVKVNLAREAKLLPPLLHAPAPAAGTPPRPEHAGGEGKRQGDDPAAAASAAESAAALPPPAAVASPPPARRPAPVLPLQRGDYPLDENDGYDEEDDLNIEAEPVMMVQPVTPLPVRKAAPAAAAAAPSVSFYVPVGGGATSIHRRELRRCKTCLLPAPDPNEAQWVCECGLRGDCAAGSEENVALRELRARKASGSDAPGMSSSSTASQSTAQGSEAKGFERELLSILRFGSKHPTFTGPEASKPITHIEALGIVRQALGASSMQITCKPLAAVIRAGLLVDVALALPRPIAQPKDKKGAVLTLDGVEVPLQASHQDTRTITSLHGFMSAMINVVLPCCIDLPAALAQWLALCATILEMDRLHGWTMAQAYAEQLLQERVATGTDFATPSASCLQTLQFSLASSTVSSASGSRSAGGVSQENPYRDFCQGYNWHAEGCRHTHCTLKHTCQYARVGCRDVGGHRSANCPHRPPPRSGASSHSSGRSGGRGGRGGGGGSFRGGSSVSGSTVASSSKPSTA